MLISRQVQTLTLAAVAPWLFDRYTAFSPMAASRPGRFQNLQAFTSYEVKYQHSLRNCEDVILEETLGIAFLSCDPGRDRWNTVMVNSRFEIEHGASAYDCRVLLSPRIPPSIMLGSTYMITQPQDWTTRHVSNSSQSTSRISIPSVWPSMPQPRRYTL